MSEENEPSEALVLQRVSEIRRMAVQLQVKLMSNSSDSLSTLRNAIVERTNELLKQMCAPLPILISALKRTACLPWYLP